MKEKSKLLLLVVIIILAAILIFIITNKPKQERNPLLNNMTSEEIVNNKIIEKQDTQAKMYQLEDLKDFTNSNEIQSFLNTQLEKETSELENLKSSTK